MTCHIKVEKFIEKKREVGDSDREVGSFNSKPKQKWDYPKLRVAWNRKGDSYCLRHM